jgi:hypothetical protein
MSTKTNHHGFTPDTALGTQSRWFTLVSVTPSKNGRDWACTVDCACGRRWSSGLTRVNNALSCGCTSPRRTSVDLAGRRSFLTSLDQCCHDEQWQPLLGFETCYLVSTCGRVYSAYSKRLLKPCTKGCYPSVTLSAGERHKYWPVHWLVIRTFRGPRKQGLETRHLDGDVSNFHLSNLRWGTPQENSDDKVRHGTMVKGSRHGMAKLSEGVVLEIRKLSKAGLKYREIAALCGIGASVIGGIVRGKTWTHV